MNKEDLKDLEQEVVDANQAFEEDWKNMMYAIKFIQHSREYLDECKGKLLDFRKQNESTQ